MTSENGNGLPPSLEAAWGVRARPAKGPRPGLSLDRIVIAAVAVAQADGLAAVSMARVAAEVDATAMALYRHVGSKNELLALMVDAALGLPPDVPGPGRGWRDGLRAWARAEAEAYRRHPWALRVPVQGVPALPNQITWLEHGLRCFAGSGVSAQDQMSTILLISNLVRIYATIDLEIADAFHGLLPDEAMATYATTMTKLLDPERFPAFTAMLASGVMDEADPMDKELTFGLERVLDGIETMIAQAGE